MKIVPVDKERVHDEDVIFSCKVLCWGMMLWRDPIQKTTVLVGGRMAGHPKKLPPRQRKV